jgi:hypothetical protein
MHDVTNKLPIKNNNNLWMEIFQNHDHNQTNNYSLKRNSNFSLEIVNPNFHKIEKYDIS